MSYESEMLKKYNMPTKQDVKKALLNILFKYNGVIKEFSADESVVAELADFFSLNTDQKNAVLERNYYKGNRIVKSPLWHRLLYRAADDLAKEKLVTRPSITYLLNNKKEWMLTEAGYDSALDLLNISASQKELRPIKSYEVEKIMKEIKEQEKPSEYSPFETDRKKSVISKEIKLRNRSFRQAVIEVYDCQCSVCGLKLPTPNNLYWEVEAAHIVPHTLNGKDDIWNGIALCRLHHWAFDCGWFGIDDNFTIIGSSKIQTLPDSFGKIEHYEFIRQLNNNKLSLNLPSNSKNYPDISAIKWHRENIFFK